MSDGQAMTRAIILAAGTNSTWDNHLGVPKHLIPIHGEPLIHRTQRLLLAAGVTDVVVGVQPEWEAHYLIDDPRVRAAVLAPVPARGWVHEWEQTRHEWTTDDRTIILYGDTYFTEGLLAGVLADQPDGWRVWARHDASKHTGCDHGEMWGWVIQPDAHEWLTGCMNVAIAYKEYGLWWRCIGWEVYRLATKQVPWHHDHLEDVHFQEWDDATEDFDTPSEWDTWRARFPDLAGDI